MSKQIGFDKLFDVASFDTGTKKIAELLGKITEEINKAKTSADEFTKIMGQQLKSDINKLQASSKSLNKEMTEITNKMNTFKATASNTKKVISDYERENEKLRKELEKLKTAQTQATKATSSASKGLQVNAQALLGVASGAAILHRGIQMITEQFKLALESVIDFEQAMKEVQAISRSTDDQLKALTDNANKLGASTEKTAVQIASLQKELAKLGFTSTEIIAASQAIVDLSTATGEDLAGSAQVTAATLRAFGLEAVETKRVVDVMAGSFVRSGLDLEKFRESMKLVAPIARATGVDIETTTAALSKLADAGLSGSLAGTALRNLLSEMADPTSKLSNFLGYTVQNSEDLIQAFKDLRDRGVDLAQAVQMVDVRARPAFFTLLNQVNAVENLSKEYGALTGEGERLAGMMRDTLKNDVEIMNSAFDALRRNSVEGAVPALRELTQTVTKIIEGIRLFNQGALYSDGIIGNLTSSYLEFIKAVYPLGVAFKVVNQALGLFGMSFEDIMEDIDQASKEQKFAEMMKEGENATDAFARSIKAVEMSKVVNEFDELASKQVLTAKETDRLNEITGILRKEYGETAIAVNKATGEIFLNTEAINRSIRATSEEAISIRKAYENRLDEINAKLQLREETVKLAKEQGNYQKMLSESITTDPEVIDLHREKAIIIDVLANSMNNLTDTSKNGWSVYINGAEGAKEATENLAKAEEERRKAEEARKKRFDASADALRKQMDEEILMAKTREQEEEFSIKTAEEAGKKEKEIFEQWADQAEEELKIIQRNADAYARQVDMEMKAGDETTKIIKEINKEKEKQRKEDEDKEKEHWNTVQEIAQIGAQGLSRITRFIFDNRQLARQNELDAINRWEEEQVRLTGDNEDAKLRIEERAEQKRLEIKRKQAQDNKKEAMFQIVIDTARAVMATLAAGAGFFSSPLAIMTAALGAAQLAIVASQPIPQFAKGTDYSPEGVAEVGEEGRELVQDGHTKKWSVTPDKSTFMYLPKGSKVLPNEQTEQILSGKLDRNEVADNYLQIRKTEIKKDETNYEALGNVFKKAVTEIPVNITNFDERGVTKFIQKRSVKLRRLNKRY